MHSAGDLVGQRRDTPFVSSITPLPLYLDREDGGAETVAGQLFRARRPDASLINFETLREKKITHIINLLSSREENEVLCPTSGEAKHLFLPELYRSQGFTETSFPIPDFGVPDQEALSRLIDQVLQRLKAGESIAIHCRSGCGRTGLVVACLAGKVFGLLGKAAILWAREQIPGAVDTAKQEAFICDFLKTHVPLEAVSARASVGCDHPLLQIATLIELAGIASERGDLIEWRAKLADAKEIAFSIEDADVCFDAWYEIFKAEIRHDKEASEDTLTNCWVSAMKIQGPSARAEACLRVARGFEKMGYSFCSQESLGDAQAAAIEEQDPMKRASALVAIARRYNEEDQQVALRLACQILKIVPILENRADKIATLTSLASLEIDDPRVKFETLIETIISISEDPAPVKAEEHVPLVKILSAVARQTGGDAGVRLLARADALFKEMIDPPSRDEAYYYLRKAIMKLQQTDK